MPISRTDTFWLCCKVYSYMYSLAVRVCLARSLRARLWYKRGFCKYAFAASNNLHCSFRTSSSAAVMHAMFNHTISTHCLKLTFQYFLIEDIYYVLYSDSANAPVISIFVNWLHKKLVQKGSLLNYVRYFHLWHLFIDW